ncbi:hypothetical protein LCGC14_2683090 [marine sediment metagenome]|uniref:ABC transporter domain-containing protein n=1 Tax=marine sediment metagenome TaxID=412755 RepID=A0A0F9CCH7_9ZZZZ
MATSSPVSTDRVLLRLQGVDKTFQMGEVSVEALKDVSLDIYAGELLVLAGPSGSGKSTILNIVGGLDTATAGRVWFGDREMTSFSTAELTAYRRDTVGFVFQFYNLVPNLSARENVMVSTELSADPMNVDEALRLVGLEERIDHFPSQMSGGEQQRVAVARALSPCPSALLLDEPFSSLDADMRSQMRMEVLSILRRAKTTAILVTHDQEEAFSLADRVGVLNKGRLEQLDTPEVIYHRPSTIFVARFVGQADFLTADVSNGRLKTEVGTFTIERSISSPKVRLMVRPDDIKIVPESNGNAVIIGRDFRGSENLYSIRLGSGQVVRSNRPSTAIYPINQRVRTWADMDHLVTFPCGESE